jgi:hypothetical protein
VKKKGRAVKDALVTKIREAISTYAHVFVFDVDNMKNSVMKEVREEWKGSKSEQINNNSTTTTTRRQQRAPRAVNSSSGAPQLPTTSKGRAQSHSYMATSGPLYPARLVHALTVPGLFRSARCCSGSSSARTK